MLNNPSATGLPFNTYGGTYTGALPMFKNVRLRGITVTQGAAITFVQCDGASVSGTHTVTNGTTAVRFTRCTDHFANLRSSTDGTDNALSISDGRAIPAAATYGGSQSPVPSAETWQVIDYTASGAPIWRYKGTWTPTAAGTLLWRVTLPVGQQMIRGTISAALNATGNSVLASIRTSGSGIRDVNCTVAVGTAGAHAVEIVIETKGN